jgi:serine phosphatase RsbU (regulator of sigma subunit)
MSPGALLAKLNAALEAAWPSDLFVSAVCLVIDPQRGRATIALAGQMPPLVRNPSSTRWLRMEAGPALGILAEQRYPERDIVLGARDLLVVVTDGVTDPLASDMDLLGLAAMARIVHRASSDPNDICASLLGSHGRSRPADDATVLTVAPAIFRRLAPAVMAREFPRLAI